MTAVSSDKVKEDIGPNPMKYLSSRTYRRCYSVPGWTGLFDLTSSAVDMDLACKNKERYR